MKYVAWLLDYTARDTYISQQTIACRKTIESLIPRVEGLAASLSAPVPEGEVKEEERRKTLKR